MNTNQEYDALKNEPEDSHENQILFSFGRTLLLTALLSALSGAILLPFYRASAAQAHASVLAIQSSVLLAVIRGMHHWASALLILGGGGYLFFVLFSGGYRPPRHIAWVAAVLLVCLFLIFQLTGHLLPWDSAAVRTAAIETGIAGNIPVIGTAQARILRGGDTVGPRTLSIWFAAHVLLLPLLTLGIAVVFLRQTGKQGQRLAIKPMLAAVAFGLILLPALLLPLPHGVPATPTDFRSYDALPEWYVLPLHSLLTIAARIHPNLVFVGSAVIPGLALLGLLALPWIEFKTWRTFQIRKVRVAAVIGAAGLLFLFGLSAKDMAPLIGATGETPVQARTQPVNAVAMLASSTAAQGRAIFDRSGCLNCHSVGGKGGAIAPPLDGEGVRHPDLDWQLRHLTAPSAVVSGSTMPTYRHLTDKELRSLASYLLSL